MQPTGFQKPVIVPSGTFGFFGEGYRYHKFIRPFASLLRRYAGFVAKTVTLEPREGNMKLNKDSTPSEMRPDCIFIDFKRWWRGGMLNAVGLSNFGLRHYLDDGRWQKRTDRWAISIMLMCQTPEGRLAEAEEIVDLLQAYRSGFARTPIIKINISCPNTAHDISKLIGEQRQILDIFGQMNTPIYVKINSLTEVGTIKEIVDHPACTGICLTNTWPWSETPDWIKYKIFPEFNEDVSPLAKYGGGAYCGKDMVPITVAWIARARQIGITKSIIGGGGIFSPWDVVRMWRAGASGISIGTPLLFRPWNVPFSILTAYVLFWRKNS